jgi:LEA14-like dessication related protein
MTRRVSAERHPAQRGRDFTPRVRSAAMKSLLAGAASAALLACALGPLAGCVSKPVISLHHAEVRDASLGGVGLEVVLKIDNPNSYDVQVRNVHAQVTIAGKYALAPIDVTPNTWLPSNQSTLVSVPLSIPWTMIPVLVTETLGSSEVKYHVTGTADVTAVRALQIEKNDYPIDEDGTLPRQVFVSASPGGIHFGVSQ